MRRSTLVVATALAVSVALGGCASSPAPTGTESAAPAYGASTAARLQAAVLSVTTRAANGDPASALTRLDEVAALAAEDRARGTISAARLASITASIELVRADLEKAIAAAQKPHGRDGKPGNPGNPGKSDKDR